MAAPIRSSSPIPTTVDQVGYCIVARKEMVEKNPDLVKRFVAATIKSYKATEADPDAAIDAMADIVGAPWPKTKAKPARAVLDVTLGLLYWRQYRPQARPQRAVGLGKHGSVDEEIQRPRSQCGCHVVLHQQLHRLT